MSFSCWLFGHDFVGHNKDMNLVWCPKCGYGKLVVFEVPVGFDFKKYDKRLCVRRKK